MDSPLHQVRNIHNLPVTPQGSTHNPPVTPHGSTYNLPVTPHASTLPTRPQAAPMFHTPETLVCFQSSDHNPLQHHSPQFQDQNYFDQNSAHQGFFGFSQTPQNPDHQTDLAGMSYVSTNNPVPTTAPCSQELSGTISLFFKDDDVQNKETLVGEGHKAVNGIQRSSQVHSHPKPCPQAHSGHTDTPSIANEPMPYFNNVNFVSGNSQKPIETQFEHVENGGVPNQGVYGGYDQIGTSSGGGDMGTCPSSQEQIYHSQPPTLNPPSIFLAPVAHNVPDTTQELSTEVIQNQEDGLQDIHSQQRAQSTYQHHTEILIDPPKVCEKNTGMVESQPLSKMESMGSHPALPINSQACLVSTSILNHSQPTSSTHDSQNQKQAHVHLSSQASSIHVAKGAQQEVVRLEGESLNLSQPTPSSETACTPFPSSTHQPQADPPKVPDSPEMYGHIHVPLVPVSRGPASCQSNLQSPHSVQSLSQHQSEIIENMSNMSLGETSQDMLGHASAQVFEDVHIAPSMSNCCIIPPSDFVQPSSHNQGTTSIVRPFLQEQSTNLKPGLFQVTSNEPLCIPGPMSFNSCTSSQSPLNLPRENSDRVKSEMTSLPLSLQTNHPLPTGQPINSQHPSLAMHQSQNQNEASYNVCSLQGSSQASNSPRFDPHQLPVIAGPSHAQYPPPAQGTVVGNHSTATCSPIIQHQEGNLELSPKIAQDNLDNSSNASEFCLQIKDAQQGLDSNRHQQPSGPPKVPEPSAMPGHGHVPPGQYPPPKQKPAVENSSAANQPLRSQVQVPAKVILLASSEKAATLGNQSTCDPPAVTYPPPSQPLGPTPLGNQHGYAYTEKDGRNPYPPEDHRPQQYYPDGLYRRADPCYGRYQDLDPVYKKQTYQYRDPLSGNPNSRVIQYSDMSRQGYHDYNSANQSAYTYYDDYYKHKADSTNVSQSTASLIPQIHEQECSRHLINETPPPYQYRSQGQGNHCTAVKRPGPRRSAHPGGPPSSLDNLQGNTPTAEFTPTAGKMCGYGYGECSGIRTPYPSDQFSARPGPQQYHPDDPFRRPHPCYGRDLGHNLTDCPPRLIQPAPSQNLEPHSSSSGQQGYGPYPLAPGQMNEEYSAGAYGEYSDSRVLHPPVQFPSPPVDHRSQQCCLGDHYKSNPCYGRYQDEHNPAYRDQNYLYRDFQSDHLSSRDRHYSDRPSLSQAYPGTFDEKYADYYRNEYVEYKSEVYDPYYKQNQNQSHRGRDPYYNQETCPDRRDGYDDQWSDDYDWHREKFDDEFDRRSVQSEQLTHILQPPPPVDYSCSQYPDQTDVYSQYPTSLEQHTTESTFITPEQLPPCSVTPEKFTIPHCCVCFGPGGHLIQVRPSRPSVGQPALVDIHSLETMLQDTPDQSELRAFPGPLVKEETNKIDVIKFSQNKAVECSRNNDLLDNDSACLLWEFIVLLCRQNGALVGTDIADLLLNKHQSVWLPSNDGTLIDNEPLTKAEGERGARPLCLTSDSAMMGPQNIQKETNRFRELLLFGHKKNALDAAMKGGLWGHALLLSSKMDNRTHEYVMTRFMSSLAITDPLQTVYHLMFGQMPASATSCGKENWRPHLAMVLSNLTHNLERDTCIITTMGDTLASKGLINAAHFCYLIARVFAKNISKIVLIGSNHSLAFSQFATNQAIQRTEAYEYAQSLCAQPSSVPNFLVYKFIYACRLAEMGLGAQAFNYCKVISKNVLMEPTCHSPVLISQLIQMSEKLQVSNFQFKEKAEALFKEPKWLIHLRQLDDQIRKEVITCNVRYDCSNINSEPTESHTLPLDMDACPTNNNLSFTSLLPDPKQGVQLMSSTPTTIQQNVIGQPACKSSTTAFQHQAQHQSGILLPQMGQMLPQMPPQIEQPHNQMNQPPPQMSPPHMTPSVTVHMPNSEMLSPARSSFTPSLDFYDHNNNMYLGRKDNMASCMTSESSTDSGGQQQSLAVRHSSPPPPRQPSITEQSYKEEPKDIKNDSQKKEGLIDWFTNKCWKMFPANRMNEAHLPDDSNMTFVFDDKKKKWVDLSAPEEESKPLPPPPSGFPEMVPVPGGPGEPANGGRAVNRFSKKAGTKDTYVDVLNPKRTTKPGGLAPANLFAPLAPMPMTGMGTTPDHPSSVP